MLGLRTSPHDGAVIELVSPMFVCVVELGVASEDGRDGETYSTSGLVWAACANVREINPRYTTPAARTPTVCFLTNGKPFAIARSYVSPTYNLMQVIAWFKEGTSKARPTTATENPAPKNQPR